MKSSARMTSILLVFLLESLFVPPSVAPPILGHRLPYRNEHAAAERHRFDDGHGHGSRSGGQASNTDVGGRHHFHLNGVLHGPRDGTVARDVPDTAAGDSPSIPGPVSGTGDRASDIAYRTSDTAERSPNTGSRAPNTGDQSSDISDPTQDSSHRASDIAAHADHAHIPAYPGSERNPTPDTAARPSDQRPLQPDKPRSLGHIPADIQTVHHRTSYRTAPRDDSAHQMPEEKANLSEEGGDPPPVVNAHVHRQYRHHVQEAGAGTGGWSDPVWFWVYFCAGLTVLIILLMTLLLLLYRRNKELLGRQQQKGGIVEVSPNTETLRQVLERSQARQRSPLSRYIDPDRAEAAMSASSGTDPRRAFSFELETNTSPFVSASHPTGPGVTPNGSSSSSTTLASVRQTEEGPRRRCSCGQGTGREGAGGPCAVCAAKGAWGYSKLREEKCD